MIGALVSNEADTRRKLVVPKLVAAGWDEEPFRLSEQVTFTDGRIVVLGNRARRRPGKRADYVLRYRPDLALAVVEAKAAYKNASDGLQQAKDYAGILALPFAYATNGPEIIEFDFLTGRERQVTAFPGPEELWVRFAAGQHLTADAGEKVLTPVYHLSGKSPRYYQEIAINRAVQAVSQGKRRMLLTMATGTGKTVVAFQICWKLWSSRWNASGGAQHRRPRILYLADRNILVDDPKDKVFAPFGDARWKIENGDANKTREMYFATYQSIARDERRPGLYREYAPDFFDLVIVDECHRGSARDESNWREILEYFEPAYQIGMTATPRRETRSIATSTVWPEDSPTSSTSSTPTSSFSAVACRMPRGSMQAFPSAGRGTCSPIGWTPVWSARPTATPAGFAARLGCGVVRATRCLPAGERSRSATGGRVFLGGRGDCGDTAGQGAGRGDRRGAAAGLSCEALLVLARRLEMRQAVADRRHEGGDDGIGQVREAIVHPEALLAGVHEAGTAQVAEVTRRARLWDVQALVDVAHAHLAAQEQAHDPQAGGIGERPQDGGQTLRGPRGAHIFRLTNIPREP